MGDDCEASICEGMGGSQAVVDTYWFSQPFQLRVDSATTICSLDIKIQDKLESYTSWIVLYLKY